MQILAQRLQRIPRCSVVGVDGAVMFKVAEVLFLYANVAVKAPQILAVCVSVGIAVSEYGMPTA